MSRGRKAKKRNQFVNVIPNYPYEFETNEKVVAKSHSKWYEAIILEQRAVEKTISVSEYVMVFPIDFDDLNQFNSLNRSIPLSSSAASTTTATTGTAMDIDNSNSNNNNNNNNNNDDINKQSNEKKTIVEEQYFVHYCNWAARFDEWLSKDNIRKFDEAKVGAMADSADELNDNGSSAEPSMDYLTGTTLPGPKNKPYAIPCADTIAVNLLQQNTEFTTPEREPYIVELPKKSNETIKAVMHRCYNRITESWRKSQERKMRNSKNKKQSLKITQNGTTHHSPSVSSSSSSSSSCHNNQTEVLSNTLVNINTSENGENGEIGHDIEINIKRKENKTPKTRTKTKTKTAKTKEKKSTKQHNEGPPPPPPPPLKSEPEPSDTELRKSEIKEESNLNGPELKNDELDMKKLDDKCVELRGVIDLLMDLFDVFIRRLQYKDVGELHQSHLIKKYFISYGILPRDIYGLEHLFRLFFLLPTILHDGIRLHPHNSSDYIHVVKPLYVIISKHMKQIQQYIETYELSYYNHWEENLVSIEEMKRLWRVNHHLTHIYGENYSAECIEFDESDEDIIVSDKEINEEFEVYDNNDKLDEAESESENQTLKTLAKQSNHQNGINQDKDGDIPMIG